MKKTYLLFAFAALFFSACEKTTDEIIDVETDSDTEFKIFDVVGSLEMDYGPYDIVIKDDYAIACRDDKIYIIDISDVENPALAATYDDLEVNNDFKSLTLRENILFAGCVQTNTIYVINIASPSSIFLINKYNPTFQDASHLKPYSMYIHENSFWAAGSNGLNGTLLKFLINSENVLSYAGSWVSTETGNAFEGVWANDSHVFVSSANGKVHSFTNETFLNGPDATYTFDAEAGHEHWGRKIWGQNNTLFWADWGAGFVTLDITNPSQILASNLITNSSFTSDFPDAEGTDAYDFTYHSNGNIYVANGWSGLLEIEPGNPGSVSKYVDYKDHLYYCIASYKDYVVLGDGAAGTTDTKGIKIIKVQ